MTSFNLLFNPVVGHVNVMLRYTIILNRSVKTPNKPNRRLSLTLPGGEVRLTDEAV